MANVRLIALGISDEPLVIVDGGRTKVGGKLEQLMSFGKNSKRQDDGGKT